METVTMVRVIMMDGSRVWESQKEAETRGNGLVLDRTPLKLAKSTNVYTLNLPSVDAVKQKILDDAFKQINRMQEEWARSAIFSCFIET